jgi:hypothetical protein
LFEAYLGAFGLEVLLIMLNFGIGVEGVVVGLGLIESGFECRHDTALLAAVGVRIEAAVGTGFILTAVTGKLTHELLELEVGVEVVGDRGGRGVLFRGGSSGEFDETDAVLIAFLLQSIGGYRDLVKSVSLGGLLFIN